MDEQQNPRPDHTDDDTEGHARAWNADQETAETDDDVEGHTPKWKHTGTAEGDDDVEGHDRRWG